MPTLTLTAAGSSALFSGDFDPTDMQLGSDNFDRRLLRGITDIGTVVRELIDFLHAHRQRNSVCQSASIPMTPRLMTTSAHAWQLWAGDPSDAGSILLGVGSTGDTTIYGEKQLGRDLLASGSFLLTNGSGCQRVVSLRA